MPKLDYMPHVTIITSLSMNTNIASHKYKFGLPELKIDQCDTNS